MATPIMHILMIPSFPDKNAVVVGLAPTMFHYEKLNEAFRLIKSQNARLIAIHKSRYMATKDGLSLGPGSHEETIFLGKIDFFSNQLYSHFPGCFVSGLEYSADVRAHIVGKPEAHFFLSALSKLKNQLDFQSLLPGEVAMIGDDVRDDVLGAQKAGFVGCLVRTGKYTPGDEDKFGTRPDFTFDSFPDAVNNLLEDFPS